MADPFVEEWHSRDLDSIVIQREVDAVLEWKKTNLTYHIMRDNPVHRTAILAGMFGVRQDTPERKILCKEEFTKMVQDFGSDWSKGMDQTALAHVVAPFVGNDCLVHDSYLCMQNYITGSQPVAFPSKRIDPQTNSEQNLPNFIGNTGSEQLNQVCPVECRPADHKDWTYC